MNKKLIEKWEKQGYKYSEDRLSHNFTTNYMVSSESYCEERVSFSKTFDNTVQFYSKDKDKYSKENEHNYRHTTMKTDNIELILETCKSLWKVKK